MKLFGDTEKEIKVMKKFLIQKLLKKYLPFVMLLEMIINKIEEPCIDWFQINQSISYQKFH